MSGRLKWDEDGKRLYETGVQNGILFVKGTNGTYGPGIPWNGLVNITEKPTGGETSSQYADNIKYLDLVSVEELEGTIEAFTYPDEFMECDGSVSVATGMYIGQQARKKFALCYMTKVGNDEVFENYGYKLHVIYGCSASPTEKAYGTINDSPEAITFSWDFKTTPVSVSDAKPTASVVLDSTKFITEEDKAKLQKVVDALWGKDAEGEETAKDSTLLMPDEIKALLA